MTVPGGLKPLPNGESSRHPPVGFQRPLEEVGGEFGVPLPAQRALSPAHGVMAGLPVGRGDAEPPRQFRQHRVIDAGAALGHEGDLDEKPGLLHQRMRARMHLADRVGTARMRGKAEHAARSGRRRIRVSTARRTCERPLHETITPWMMQVGLYDAANPMCDVVAALPVAIVASTANWIN